jgi:hypothetical protein
MFVLPVAIIGAANVFPLLLRKRDRKEGAR